MDLVFYVRVRACKKRVTGKQLLKYVVMEWVFLHVRESESFAAFR